MSNSNFTANILQWNCRNIKTNLTQFTQFLHSSQTEYHAICLQSLCVKKGDLPFLSNFYYPPLFSTEGDRVRTATYVKKSLQVTTHKSINGVHSDVCEIHFSSTESLKIINTYFPVGCENENNTSWIADLQTGNVLLVGDFNAHHPYWGGIGTRISRGGQWLFNSISESNLCLLNDGSDTRLPNHRGENPSIIDLSLISSELFVNSDWQTAEDPLGSDHLPITITVGNFHMTNNYELKYDYSKANWDQFEMGLVMSNYTDVNPDSTIDNQYDAFRNIVLSVADTAIPKKSIQITSKLPPNPWWTQICHGAVKAKRQAYKRYKRHQNEETYTRFRDTRIHCKKVIAKAKVDYWRQYLSKNVAHYSDTKILFKHVKILKQRYCPVERPLINNGVKTKNEHEKANLLAETFAKASRSENLSKSARDYRQKEDSKRSDPPDNPDCPLNKRFSLSEMRQCIKSITNNKKATGIDPISYSMIQHFPSKMIEHLLAFYNRCWEAGTVPAAWKQATVVAVPKAGKPPSSPSSYRPISLTPHLGKIYERMIKARLEHHLCKEHVIPNIQAGFQRGRGCSDHLVKLSAHVKRALAKRRTTLAAFYDVHRAYDSVWHGRLLSKLAKIGLSGSMFNFCKSFLTDRSFCVKIGSVFSQRMAVDMGVPQGSIIAPTFFNIMLHDITTVKLKNAQITLYADDLLLFSNEDYKNLKSEYVKKVIMKRFQYNVNLLINYMTDNGFALAAEKTVFMIFNRSKFAPDKYFIIIDNCKIFPSNDVKYLGVVIDKNMSWNSHVKRNIEKTRHIWNLLKLLKRTEGASDPKNLCHVIRALVRSRLLYGHEAYFAAHKNTITKLQTAECKFLRYVLDMKNSVPQDVVYREVGWLPLTYEIKLRTSQYVYRAATVDNSTNEELDIHFDNMNDPSQQRNLLKTPRINSRMLSVANFVEEMSQATNIQRSEVVKIPLCPIPPWELNDMNIKDSLGSSLNKEDHMPLLASLAREKIDTEHHSSTQIFTDGSKLENGQVGCAFYIPSLQVIKHHRLNDGVSIFTAEMFAILMALSYCRDSLAASRDIVILTDSRSSLQALDSKSKNRREMSLDIEILIHELNNNGCSVSFQWIPSHCDITGNDIADKAAKDGAMLPHITNNVKFTMSEISCKLKKVITDEWKEHYRSMASDRNWIVREADHDGLCPDLPRHHLPIFFRLRGKTYLAQYTPQNCICNEQLSFNHIFQCQQLIPSMPQLLQLSVVHNFPLTPRALLNWHPTLGWKVAKHFIQELCETGIGHMV